MSTLSLCELLTSIDFHEHIVSTVVSETTAVRMI